MSDITLYAHRGSNPFPDHSREAYVAAINWGADVIEPDLFLTKDGVLVASHDNHNYANSDLAPRRSAAQPALMTFGEVIELAKAMSIETGREIGIIPEDQEHQLRDQRSRHQGADRARLHRSGPGRHPELLVGQSANAA